MGINNTNLNISKFNLFTNPDAKVANLTLTPSHSEEVNISVINNLGQ